MSSRQLWSKGESDGLSLPYDREKDKSKGKKSSNQQNWPDMEQQQQNQLQQHAIAQLSPLQV